MSNDESINSIWICTLWYHCRGRRRPGTRVKYLNRKQRHDRTAALKDLNHDLPLLELLIDQYLSFDNYKSIIKFVRICELVHKTASETFDCTLNIIVKYGITQYHVKTMLLVKVHYYIYIKSKTIIYIVSYLT